MRNQSFVKREVECTVIGAASWCALLNKQFCLESCRRAGSWSRAFPLVLGRQSGSSGSFRPSLNYVERTYRYSAHTQCSAHLRSGSPSAPMSSSNSSCPPYRWNEVRCRRRVRRYRALWRTPQVEVSRPSPASPTRVSTTGISASICARASSDRRCCWKVFPGGGGDIPIAVAIVEFSSKHFNWLRG